MTIFEAAKTVTALEVAERYAGVQARRRGAKSWCRCPLPGHPGDRTPSCSFDEKGRFYCFGCDTGGTSIDMAMKLLGLDSKEAALRVCTDFGRAYEDTKPTRKERPKVTPAQARQALDRFDTAAAGYLRFLEAYTQEKAASLDPEADFPEEFTAALKQKNTLKDICDRLFSVFDSNDLETGLELLAAYQKEIPKWEAIAKAWKEERREAIA